MRTQKNGGLREKTEMVFNSAIVFSVAETSADLWQYLACAQERLTTHHLLDLLCCIPLDHLGRFALCLWSFLCLPPPDSFYSDSDSDSSSSSSSRGYDGYYYHHSHSD